MTSLRLARRSADRFDALLEGAEREALDRQTAEFLELVGALRSAPRVEARPEFVTSLRERLMLEAELALAVPDPAGELDRRLTVAPRRTPRERRIAVALGGFAIVGAATSMAVAAQSALPGDALYPLKRAMENAETGFRVSDDAKGTTILANATGRLDEVGALTREGQGSAEDIEQTLNTFAEQATEASDLLLADYAQTGDESSVNQLRDFTAESIALLGSLEAFIPASAEDALLNAADVLYAIDALAAQVCPTCASEGITEIPPPLLASGGPSLDGAQQALSDDGWNLAAAAPPIKPTRDPKGEPKGADDPETAEGPSGPVAVPATPDPSGGTGPGAGSDPSQGVGGVNVGGGSGGSQDDKKDQPVPEDVKEAVDAVVEDVNEVVDGLGDALGGSSDGDKGDGDKSEKGD